jgi:hypothetical protein
MLLLLPTLKECGFLRFTNKTSIITSIINAQGGRP